ncbi:MAG TPA: cell wall-binding repeat-containing protein [Euzebya sp.]|nr:cell wall-binding repeat-containing protein [Euzebya sp.]
MNRTLGALLALLLLVTLLPWTAGAQELPLPGQDELPDASADPDAPAGTVLFPSDALTVADPAQATGRRLALPLPDCDQQASRCADLRHVNTLDGFDVLPRVAVRLDRAPDGDLAQTFGSDVVGVRPAAGGDVIGLARLVYDPATMTLYGEPADQLAEATQYDVVYQDQTTRFTTMSASAGLVQMRHQLDSGAAHDAAGIAPADRGLSFTQGDLRTVFPAQQVATVTRYDEIVRGGEPIASQVLDTALLGAGTIAFGSFLSPSWLSPTRTIPAAPTGGDGPAVTGVEQVGVTLILPAGTAPEGGWPLAIFGPGITRSKYDLFLAADGNAAQGLATMAFDPVGHAFGTGSQVGVQTLNSPDEVRFSGFGRGVDLNDDGVITDQEGVQAPAAPHPDSSVGLRDGLRQTAADLMALVRAVQLGADVDGDGQVDLATDDIAVYAQSLGGIYSTMVMGADPQVQVAVLNVPGGGILDIARVSPVFRALVGDILRDRIPGLLNGGIDTFTEELGLFGVDPAIEDPTDGSLAIQEVFYDANWIARPGSPEAFAPLIRTRPLPDSQPKDVLYQFALGDQTVPNPASFRLARAFGDGDRIALYRNDLTTTAMTNPHGFLLDPRIQGRNQAQQQVVDFITSDGQTITDPDGPLPTWEVPISDRTILQTRNFDEALYADSTDRPAREVERVEGEDRVATAVAVSRQIVDQATTVVIARADDYADALSGGPLAVHLGGPLLLSDPDQLSAATAGEIGRLEAETAVLLGGEAALSAQVASDLETAGLTVDRVAGANRFDTAALTAGRLGHASEVLLVEGANADPARGWPDALSAAGIGSGLRQPILLVEHDRLPEETAAALSEAQDVTVIGGTAAVSDVILTQVDALVAQVSRVAGADRYTTSAAAAEQAILRGLAPTHVWLASGAGFADGLVAGAAAGATGGILLLVDPASLDASPDVARWLRDHGASVDLARVVGGVASISSQVHQDVAGTLAR